MNTLRFLVPVSAALVLVSAGGCDDGDNHAPTAAQTAVQGAALTLTHAGAQDMTQDRVSPRFKEAVTLPWGTGDGEVGLVPLREERPPVGPLAISLANDGSVWLLDQVNRRLVHLDADGKWLETRPAPPGATDIAVDSKGRVAVYSRINLRIALIGTDGIEELIDVPHGLQHVAAMRFDSTGRLLLETARQETFDLGREGARIPWPDLLNTKVEGIGQAAGGDAVQAVLKNGKAFLMTPIKGERRALSVQVADERDFASIAIIGAVAHGETVVLLERFVGENNVDRALRRVSAEGKNLGEVAIESKPLYFPFSEFAVASDGNVVALEAHNDGLQVKTIAVGGNR